MLPDKLSKSETHEPLHWSKRPIRESSEARDALTILIGGIHAIQKNYNAPAEHLKLRDAAFQEALAGYCYDEVEVAFKTYTRRAPDVPAVYDILSILEPQPPVFHPTMVVAIKKEIRDGVFVSDEKRAYCRGYEQQELGKVEQFKQYQQQRQASDRKPALMIAPPPVNDLDAGDD
jgi:hypothetical protein